MGGEALKVFQPTPLHELGLHRRRSLPGPLRCLQGERRSSAIEFLANGEGAFHFQELAQNAAGEGVDLSDSSDLESFQQEVIDTMENLCG